MWKQLFAEPPPNAVENLLTPRRKLVYCVIAFAPGTLLALYLNSVKKRMDEENEVLRLKHISEEAAGEAAREQKDLVLAQMVQELRERIEQLEREARAETVANKASENKQTKVAIPVDAPASLETVRAKSPSTSTRDLQWSEPRHQRRTELPSFLIEYEDTLRPWLDRLDAIKSETGKLADWWASVRDSSEKETNSEAKTPVPNGVQPSGIRQRVEAREREMRAQDYRDYKGSTASASSRTQ